MYVVCIQKFSHKRDDGVGLMCCGSAGVWMGLWCCSCTSLQPQVRAGVAAGWFQESPKPEKQAQGQSEKWQLQGQAHTWGTMDGPDRAGTLWWAVAEWVWSTSPSLAWGRMQLSINQACRSQAAGIDGLEVRNRRHGPKESWQGEEENW